MDNYESYLHDFEGGFPVSQCQRRMLRFKLAGDGQRVVWDNIEFVEPQHVCGRECVIHSEILVYRLKDIWRPLLAA